MRPTLAATTLMAAGLLSLLGCGGSDDSGRARVRGKVMYENEPVRAGVLQFNPDANRKGSGVQGTAIVKNGSYDTNAGGKGGPPGPVVIRLDAFDGVVEEGKPHGTLLFTYETTGDLNPGETTIDLNLKKGQVIKAPKTTGPGP